MIEKFPVGDLTAQPAPELNIADAGSSLPRFDVNDPEAVEKKLREMDGLFSSTAAAPGDASSAGSGHGDRDRLVLERRKQAILNLFYEAESRFADKYPELCIADELIRFNAPARALSFRQLNKEYYIELAAAILILDCLKETDRFEEARPYFPSTREELNSVYLPMLSDSVHSDDELRSMLCLIRYRNRGKKGYDGRIAFCDEADTGLTKADLSEDTQDRKNFDAVMSLIDKEAVKEAQNVLIEHIWDFFDSLLHIVSKRKSDPIDTADEAKNAETAVDPLYCSMTLLPDAVRGALSDERVTELFAEAAIPKISDPYEICFAYLSLLDENSDYAWLHNLCCVIVAFACRALPWADSMVVDPDGDAGELRVDYDYLRSIIEKHPDWDADADNENLYEMNIPSPLLSEKRAPTSIAKLAFLSSGLIPPRTNEAVSFTKALLAETDYSPETRRMIYSYIVLAYSVNHKGSDFETPDDDRIAEELSQEKEISKDKDAEIKKLRAEIKHLKNLLNHSEHQKKDISSELAESRRRLETANSELAELRSMIRESCDTGESSPTTVSLPYTVTERTVIVGGHESWVKAIKPLLNNARFISSSEQPNPGVILNAEVVWIQSNAMGHSSFYKIIDIIRKHDIKVRYFKYASAEKCAEQLALEDLASSSPAEPTESASQESE